MENPQEPVSYPSWVPIHGNNKEEHAGEEGGDGGSEPHTISKLYTLTYFLTLIYNTAHWAFAHLPST